MRRNFDKEEVKPAGLLALMAIFLITMAACNLEDLVIGEEYTIKPFVVKDAAEHEDKRKIYYCS